MSKVLLLFIVAMGFCAPGKALSQAQVEAAIKNKIILGDDKQAVMQALHEIGVAGQSYERLMFPLVNGEIDPSVRLFLGKELPLNGTYGAASAQWKNTRYGLIARFKGRNTDIWVRFSFDEEEKLLACYLREQSDVS